MRNRVTRIALTLVVLASMSMTLGAGMRWSARIRAVVSPSIVAGPSLLVAPAEDVTVVVDVEEPDVEEE